MDKNELQRLANAYPEIKRLGEICENYIRVWERGGDEQETRDYREVTLVLSKIDEETTRQLPREDLDSMGRALAGYLKHTGKLGIAFDNISGYILPSNLQERELAQVFASMDGERKKEAGAATLLMIPNNGSPGWIGDLPKVRERLAKECEDHRQIKEFELRRPRPAPIFPPPKETKTQEFWRLEREREEGKSSEKTGTEEEGKVDIPTWGKLKTSVCNILMEEMNMPGELMSDSVLHQILDI